MRRALADIESGSDVTARNRHSTASGKYQFVRGWDPYFKKMAGYTWTSTLPKKEAAQSVKDEAGRKQDKLFDIYYADLIDPWMKKAKAKYPTAQKLSSAELLALAHRQGTAGANLYLKTGRDIYGGKLGNKPVATHLRAMRRQMEFYGYLDTQHQLVAARKGR